eukprot:1137470-Pelagomonas_calceolata.AAC.9
MSSNQQHLQKQQWFQQQQQFMQDRQLQMQRLQIARHWLSSSSSTVQPCPQPSPRRSPPAGQEAPAGTSNLGQQPQQQQQLPPHPQYVQDSADANGTDLHIDLEESDQEELMDQGQAQEGQEGQDAQVCHCIEGQQP